MRQVRNSVFETNSSSTHCICIVSDRKAELKYPERVYFRCDEFGRWPSDLRSVEDKAAYLYASILSLYERDKAEKAKAWIMDELTKSGVQCEFETANYHSYGCGLYCTNAHVDHAGEDDHQKFVESVLRSSGRLRRYLFSDKSLVLTSSDEIDDDRVDNFHAKYKHEFYYKGN